MKNSMQIPFKTNVSKKSNVINLKVRLFTSFMKKIYFQAIQDPHYLTAAAFLLPYSSEGTGANHRHHHYVADCCQHSNP